MKLISLHIENFGKLSNFDYTFKDDLNVFHEENGWGKTTLCTFIKAMFFGMDKFTKSQKIKDNERGRYAPWNNNSYGGKLVFETNGKKYQIERTFDRSSSVKDTFKLIDLTTNETSNDYDISIGEEIFKINEKGFSKSVFIPQNNGAVTFDNADSIQAKLAALVGGMDDTYNVADALEALNKEDKALKKEIAETKTAIKAYKEKIKETDNALSSMDSFKEDMEKEKGNLEALTLKRKSIDNQINEYYKDLDKAKNLSILEEKKREMLIQSRKLSEINKLFVYIDTNKETLNSYKETEKNLSIAKANKEDLLNNSVLNNRQYYDLSEIFKKKSYNENEIAKTEEKIRKLEKPEEKEIKSEIIKKPNTVNFILMGSGAAFLLAGIILLFINNIAAAISLVLGIIALLAGIILFVNNKGEVKTTEVIRNNSEDLEITKSSLYEFFARYSLFGSDFKANLKTLKENYMNYQFFNKKKNEEDEKLSSIEKSIYENETKLNNYLSLYQASSLSELEKILDERDNLSNDIAKKNKEIEDFIRQHDLNNIREHSSFNLEEADSQKKETDEKIKESNKRIADDEAKINSLLLLKEEKEEKENLLVSLNDELEEKENKKRLTIIAISKISEADRLIKEKYVKPMTDATDKYLSLLFKDRKGKFVIDTDFNYSGDEKEGHKELAFYSSGYQDIISLCLRFALVDCLFSDVKPFIVLDDSFVNLDESKLNEAKELVKELSNQYQIVYFTCHDSRMI